MKVRSTIEQPSLPEKNKARKKRLRVSQKDKE